MLLVSSWTGDEFLLRTPTRSFETEEFFPNWPVVGDRTIAMAIARSSFFGRLQLTEFRQL